MSYLADHSSLGDDAPASTPLRALLEQVNRFAGPSAPAEHRFAAMPFDVASSNLTASAAYVAIMIYQTRLVVAQTKIADSGTASQITQVTTAIKDGPAAILSWVSKNIGRVTASIGGYADQLGLAGVKYVVKSPFDAATGSMFKDVTPVMVAVGVAVAYVGYAAIRGKKR